MKNTTYFILMLVVISTLFIAGCTQPQTVQPTPVPTTPVTTSMPSADTIRLASGPLGNILVDAKGMTLYYFSKDMPASGASTCYGQCQVAWPVFYADPVTVSSPLFTADFATITRTDGTKQTTYRGWPLYYYQADKKPGDLTGENVGKIWFVVKPDATVMIMQMQGVGLYLTDRVGKTLYFFTSDTAGTSTCTGACLVKWPAFNGDPVSASSLVKTSDFSAVARADGVKQTAFMGKPLYYFADDMMPGEIKGEGFNNVWYVANVSGITPVVTTMPTTLKTLSPSYGSSY